MQGSKPSSSLPGAFGANIQMGKGGRADLSGCRKHFWSKTCCLLPGSELCRASTSQGIACNTRARFPGCSCFRPAFSCPLQLLDTALVPQPTSGTESPVCDGKVVQSTRFTLRRTHWEKASLHCTHPSHHPRGVAGALPAMGRTTDH